MTTIIYVTFLFLAVSLVIDVGLEIADLKAQLKKVESALIPFAECERQWMKNGKRCEIRMDWLTAAREALDDIK